MFPVVPVWQVYLWHRHRGETLRQHLQLKSFINLGSGTVSEILMLCVCCGHFFVHRFLLVQAFGYRVISRYFYLI